MHRVLVLMAVGVVSSVTAGCGGGDHEKHGGASGAKADRTIEVTMKEFVYEPASISVKSGETVKFAFRNVGRADHDAFIGDDAAQGDHERAMRGGGTKEHGPGHLRLAPGKTGELTHTFGRAGDVLIIGCHEPAHYDAGMKMTVTVS